MKRIAIIFLSIYYMAGSVGVAVNLHYCGDQLSNVAITSEDTSCCCDSSEPMENCCDDEKLFFQIDEDQKLVQNFRTNFNEAVNLLGYSSSSESVSEENSDEDLIYCTDLPPPEKRPLWLLDCSLVYYG